MNKHIELAEKWLEDNNSVTTEELRVNSLDAQIVFEAYPKHERVDRIVAYYVARTAVNTYWASVYVRNQNTSGDALKSAIEALQTYKELIK